MSRLVLIAMLAGCLGPDDDLRVNPGDTDEEVLAGEVAVRPEALTMDGVVGDRTTGTVTIENIGESPLTLISATLFEDGGGVFETDEETNANRTLSPDRTYDVLINCRLAEAVQVAGTLRIETNDPEDRQVSVPLLCVPPEDDTDGA